MVIAGNLTRDNLPELYPEQGNYAEAEPLYRRALATRETTLGPEHPDICRSSELGLGCVKTSDERAKCHFGSTVEIPVSMKSMP